MKKNILFSGKRSLALILAVTLAAGAMTGCELPGEHGGSGDHIKANGMKSRYRFVISPAKTNPAAQSIRFSA